MIRPDTECGMLQDQQPQEGRPLCLTLTVLPHPGQNLHFNTAPVQVVFNFLLLLVVHIFPPPTF